MPFCDGGHIIDIDRAHHASDIGNDALRTTVGLFLYKRGYDMNVLKPALTYQQQIDRLENIHGLKIPDKSDAERVLSRISYYRLSAYGIGLKRTDDPERYCDGISFDTLHRLYLFDMGLRNLLLPLIERIEIELREKISYHIGTTYGPEGYIDSANFKQITDRYHNDIHKVFVTRFQNEVQQRKTYPFVAHHLNKYDGHFPVWAAMEICSFGMLSSLYKVMKNADQKAISARYGTSPANLTNWILVVLELRNRCAHYGRLYNMQLQNPPKLLPEHAAHISDKKLFSRLLVIRYMTFDADEWRAFCTKLSALMEEYSDVIRMDYLNFPDDWESILRM